MNFTKQGSTLLKNPPRLVDLHKYFSCPLDKSLLLPQILEYVFWSHGGTFKKAELCPGYSTLESILNLGTYVL